MPDFSLERAARRRNLTVVAGVDEAGRGPWAGPVVAGAAVLDEATLPRELLDGLDDSKKLKPARREALLERLRDHARLGVGVAAVAEIDRLNILEATLLAMARAVADLGAGRGAGGAPDLAPDLALVDGNRAPALPCAVQCVVGGDGKSLSIAAASILAKVTRDGIMADLARDFPAYGWERNAGYGTRAHRDALDRFGITPHHRRSFAPILRIIEDG